MPENVLVSEIEIITDGGRRRRWSAIEKMRIVEETTSEIRHLIARLLPRPTVTVAFIWAWSRWR